MVSKSSSKAKEKQVTMASATRSDNNANASSSGGASMHGKVQSIVSENFAAETEGGSGSGSGRTVQGVVKKIQERKEKRLTSKIWNHFTRSFVDVREGDKVVKKKMAECHYCKIVLSADSSKVLVAKSSTMQWEIFLKQAEDLGLYTKKGLALDVSTRWNSTYLMLADALHYKKVFQRLVLLYPEKYSRHAPSREDWEKASVLCMCLKIFLNVTKLLSGSYYPTANLFFVEFSEINIQLIEWTKGSDGFIVAMAKAMQDKFNKYWEMSNIALAVACFLDPRYKMKVVEFYYELMCDNSGIKEIDEFRKVVKELFDSYASLYTNAAMSIMHPPGRAHHYVDLDDEPKKRKLDAFLNDICEVHQEQSEMDKYCSEPLLRWPKDEHFDILSWWKTQGVKYPILARLARDVLAIPASTVASESAFSTGGRVIDKYRSRLDPEVVEGLICTKDWIRASRKDQSEVASIREDLDISEINDKVEQDEGGYSSATGDGNDMDVEEN